MTDNTHLELTGIVEEASKGIFRILIDNSQEHIVLARISGKMRKYKINVVVGDKVKLKVSPYDINTGFITQRI